MIAVAGGYGVGMTMNVVRAPAAGETVAGGLLSIGPGGKGSNQAVAIRRLGAACTVFTAIGDDAAGLDARRLWADEGVDDSAVVVGRSATMTGFILVEPDGENRIAIADGALADLRVADVAGFAAAIRNAALLVVSLEIPVPVATEALRLARRSGTRTLLNPAPATDLDAGVLELVDVLTPNWPELARLAGADAATSDPDAAIDRLRRTYSGAIVVTLGGDGVIVDDGDGRDRIPALSVAPVVDTTGAGDAFTAALAVALGEGRPLRDAARFAVAAGAAAVTVAEVIPALPRRERVEKLLSAQTLGSAAIQEGAR